MFYIPTPVTYTTRMDNLRITSLKVLLPSPHLWWWQLLFVPHRCVTSAQVHKQAPLTQVNTVLMPSFLWLPHRAGSWVCDLCGSTGPHIWKEHGMVRCSAVTILKVLINLNKRPHIFICTGLLKLCNSSAYRGCVFMEPQFNILQGPQILFLFTFYLCFTWTSGLCFFSLDRNPEILRPIIK